MDERQGKVLTLKELVGIQKKHQEIIHKGSEYDLTNQSEYDAHAVLIGKLGDNYLGREFRKFEFDEYNKKLMSFLLYYFNNCRLAEDVFEGEDYKIHKNILLVGEPGTGKTIIMQIFSDYLKLTRNPNYFYNLSVTQLMNYYKLNSHIDLYTYNDATAKGSIDGEPFHVCINDVGLETENQKSYGTSLDSVIDELLYARYEIYQQRFIKYHMTSNLSVAEFQKRFGNRLIDRFKSFNTIALTGSSRRK